MKESTTLSKEKKSFVGKAADAKAGAALVDDQTIYYIEGLDFWPESVRAKKVFIVGNLNKKKMIPDSSSSAKGVVTQGALGSQFVIKNARWVLNEIVPKHPGFVLSVEQPGGIEKKKLIQDIPLDHQFVFMKNGKEAGILEQADTVIPIVKVEVHFSKDRKKILEINELGPEGQSLRRTYGAH